MSKSLALGLVFSLICGGLTVLADDDRETVVLAFVRANHPELGRLLDQLKPMKPADYDRAIREIEPVAKVLAHLKIHDPRRYDVGLEVWKARSRVELLTAQLAGASATELESQLRAAIEIQCDAELKQQKLERTLVEARLKKLGETIDRMETNREKRIESRYQELLKKGRRARRLDAGKSAPAPAPLPASSTPVRPQGESKP